MSRRLHRERAERYALSLPARVRPEGHSTWRDGEVVNVSRSGVLLSVAASFPPAESLDLVFGVTDGAARTADVRCVANVVRETHDGHGRALLAATIDRYVFAPPPTES
jgi:PilZ domain